MGKGSGDSRSLLRLLVWEGLALAWFVHLGRHPLAIPIWSLHFHYGALFFLAAYPLLYVYRWKLADGILRFILWPVSFVLGWGLGVSTYLWVTYILFFTGNPFTRSFMNHWWVLGPLYGFLYFPLIQPLLGTSVKYQSLGQLFWTFLYSGLGGFLGYLLGAFVDKKYGVSIGDNRFLLWVTLLLIGAAVGAMAARRAGAK
ncbi:MAG TPA: hypothetical protein VMV05_06060 [bacterium]|nr:hypothetical protein [bacterium]